MTTTNGDSTAAASNDKPWLAHYPAGVRWDIATDT
jgi:hypothetical protein